MTFHGVQVFSLHACRSVCKVPATRKDCTLARFWSYLISCVIVAWKRAGSGTGFCPTCFPWQRFLWNSSGRTAHIASHNSTESKAFFFFFLECHRGGQRKRIPLNFSGGSAVKGSANQVWCHFYLCIYSSDNTLTSHQECHKCCTHCVHRVSFTLTHHGAPRKT